VIDYDREAASYDDTRGGPERAAAVAASVGTLLTGTVLDVACTVLDVACGTGIVTALLANPATPAGAGDVSAPARRGGEAAAPAPAGDGGPARGSAGRPVLGVDRSAGMLAVAAGRLPGRVLLGDATRLPVASGSVGAVLMVWLLHLLSSAESEAALAEAVRVAAPGGRVITTVDKGAAYFAAPSDLREATAPWRRRIAATDRFERVTSLLAGHGLRVVGESTFPGVGQGRSPRDWRAAARAGRIPWARDDPDGVEAALAGLPDQDRPRPEPVYRLIAFSAAEP
jgi:SAM-dependent methyltransferase